MKKSIIISASALFIGALMLVSSCSKHDGGPCGPDANQKLDKKVKTLVSKLPHLMLTKGTPKTRPGVGDSRDNGFNFSDPGSGISFSVSSSGLTFTQNANTIYVSTSAFGTNSASGTVVAGGTTLDINYTFCFSASDSASGLNLFDMGNGGFSGVSAVIGVSGDFSALATADSSTSFSDVFKGLAFYIVYDDVASGNYDVIDWTSGLNNVSNGNQKSFAFAFDFQKGKLYLSSGGKITVTGGSMDFNGEYLEVGGFTDSDGNFDVSGNLTYTTVSGFGAMGCN